MSAPPVQQDGPTDGDLAPAEVHARLTRTWGTPQSIWGALTTVDHKIIGRRYIVTAFLFLILGGLSALSLRLQLAQPGGHYVDPELYNQLFTMHGTTMMFLFAVPVMEGFAVYLVPLMVGTRNLAFPRLNAYGYYVYVLGGLMIWIAFELEAGPNVGWFAYVPLAGLAQSPGKGVDFWAQMVTFTEVAAMAVGIEIIVTVFKQRAPGMSLDRIPIFVWSHVVTSFAIIFAMPAIMVATSTLILDRLVGTHFFDPETGGVLLWQHLFWFFGHPEVYIIFLPAVGIVSEIVTTFSRRPVFGYAAIVVSIIAIGFLSFGLWVHHMFATGLPQLGASLFTAASTLIAVPSGLQIFCFLATLWGARIRFATPMLFVIGFIITFVIGGLTGVMLASVPIDTQVHDTYFVVGHFHYVLIGGAVFPLLAGTYYWFPKLSGRMLGERLGQVHFAMAFLSFNIAFFPMHILGLEGMPRRIYTYPAASGWGDLNLVSSVGAGLFALSFVIFFWNIFSSLRQPASAPDNPWDAPGLEWATSSPPPPHNFDRLPAVEHREPLWAECASRPVVTGLAVDERELVITTLTDATPDLRELSPGPSIWPPVAAIVTGLVFVGSIYTPWAVVWGAIPLAVAFIGWFWPKSPREDRA